MAREEHGFAGAVNSETRKPLFDFFVQIMKYFLSLINTHIEAEFNAGAPEKDTLCVIRSANKLLASFKNENIYLHTEDTAEGASINFLRFIYQTVMSFSAKIKHLLLLSISSDNGFPREVLLLIAKGIVVALHHLMDIEYEIVGADLENLWLVMFTFIAYNHATVDPPDEQSLSLEILNLGCSLVDLYSELRQVNFSIFSLSKVVRLLASSQTDNEAYPTHFYNSCSTSLVTLICSTEFRLSVWNAIKSIPEGQVSGCIQQLTADTSECLEWLKVQLHLGPGNNLSKLGPGGGCFSWFNLKTELLGRVISEIYTLILDSMVVTVGNSNALGHSVEQLKGLMCCNSQGGDLRKPDNMDKFFSMISGRTDSQGAVLDNDSLSCWLLVFLFRLYLSCRSLYRQVISLVPPDKSMKMSETMGDPHTAHAGKDWLEGVVKNDEGYFSWIIKPSDTLLNVISYVSNNLQDNLADCPPLVYVLNAMTLQRLVDLNKILNSFEYLCARNDKLVETKVIGDTGIPLLLKRNKKFRKCLLNMKQEAAGLTKFMLSWVSSLVKVPTLIASNNGLCENLSIQDLHEENAWDLSIGTLNEKSLPSAIGWIVSQHADVWCDHAAKKDLKKFLRLMIRCSLPSERAGMDRRFMSHHIEKLSHLKTVETVTTCRISLVLLNDTGLYEQKFFRRHIASVSCHILEASLTSSDSGEGYLDSKPDWSQVVLSLDNLSNGVSNEKCAQNNYASQMNPISILHTDSCRREQLAPSCKMEYALCSSLLNFVRSMPRGVLSSKSLLQFATCILNVERVLVGNLLSWHRTLSNGGHGDLFRLFLSCRRTLKSLLMASCDEKRTQDCYLIIFLLSESSFPVLWLLKSITAVIGIPSASSEEFACQMPDIFFSLMDHTSYMFLTIGRYQFELAMRFYGIGSDGKHSDATVSPGTDLTEDEPPLSLSSGIDLWRILALLNEILREQVHNFCSGFNEPCVSENFGVSPEFLVFKKSSSVMSCIQGFLWGLASGLDGTDAETSKIRVKFSKCNTDPLYKLNILIEECAESLIYLLQLLVLKDEFGQSFAHAQITEVSESGHVCSGKAEPSAKVDTENCGPIGEHGIRNRNSVSDKCGVRGNSCTENAAVESLLVNVELFDQQHLNRTLLRDLLRGDNVEVAFFLKQLLLASSAIMRLKLKLNCTSPLENLMPISFGICQVLLSEFASMVSVPPPFSFVLLDGAVKLLAELGPFSPILSKELYVKLIDLHLKSIGKCIVLQGKRAVVPSKESESSIKYPLELFNSSDSSQPSGTCYLDDFKARLRMSLRRLVQKSSELHLLSAIQAIERTVVGVREDCLTNYEICAGSFDSGKVTSTVAAGIDCLDLVIEFVTGRKRMNVVKRHIQGLVSCLLNIILHLKGPSIFSECVNCDYGYASPDSGSVILMCIDILIRVAGKHALFQMDACHVSQFLNIPAALFQNFLQIRLIEALDKSNSLSNLGTLDTCFLKSTSVVIVDQRYSSELYAGCCRLLCTVVKHHTSETQHCSVLLQHSVSILLHCLEMVKRDSTVSRGSFAWELQDGVKCACCLRRIYEEIRQQKDWIGRYSYQFLSEYIRVYCGCGPLTTGIIREVDEALRPGIYALIDACSDDDLQHLHTVFGEGPLRSCLATLRNDYKLYFQYEGKV